jgi:pimeloyl-ACP methyl ester carboxylesterase
MIASGIVLGIGALAAYTAWLFGGYVKLIMRLLDDFAPIPENGKPEPHGAKGERVRFYAADGHPLYGLIFSSQRESEARGLVIFAHEFGSSSASCLRYCEPLLSAGFDVFAFDFRGHGDSPAEAGYRPRYLVSDREVADLRGAVTFAESLRDRHGLFHLGLFGISRGGAAAVLAAEKCPSVKAVVVDGLFSNDAVAEYLIKRFAPTFARIRFVAERHPPVVWRFFRWLLFRAYGRQARCRYPSVRKALARLTNKPLFLIHGEKDSYVPYQQTEALFQLAPDPKELWVVPGAKHNQGYFVAKEPYADRLIRFFRNHLSSASPSGETFPVHYRPAPTNRLSGGSNENRWNPISVGAS